MIVCIVTKNGDGTVDVEMPNLEHAADVLLAVAHYATICGVDVNETVALLPGVEFIAASDVPPPLVVRGNCG